MAKKKQVRHKFRVEFDCYLDCEDYMDGEENIKRLLQKVCNSSCLLSKPIYIEEARISGPITLVLRP